MRVVGVVAVLMLAVGGCGLRYWYTNAIRTSSLATTRAANCALEFRHASAAELPTLRLLGSICLVAENWIDIGFIPPDEFTEDVRSHLAADACRLGGEVVTVGGRCRLRNHETVSFDVYGR